MTRLFVAATTFLAYVGVAVAQPIGLGTSPQGTLGYTLGAVLSKTLAETANMPSRVQPSSGTGTMIPLVNSGEIDFGFANAIEVSEAFNGTGTFDKRPQPNLRIVSLLFPFRVGLFAFLVSIPLFLFGTHHVAGIEELVQIIKTASAQLTFGAGLWLAGSEARATLSGPMPDALANDRDLAQMRHELAATKEYLQSLLEQQDAANEELRSANLGV